MKRGRFALLVVVVSVLSAALPSLAVAGGAQEAQPTAEGGAGKEGFSWTQFQGKTLYLLNEKVPNNETIVNNIGKFEALTGMKVVIDTLPEIQKRQKIMVEMAAQSSTVDVYTSAIHVEKKSHYEAGWYEILNPYMSDSSITPPDWSWNDFTNAAHKLATHPNGDISTIPLDNSPHIFFYRKDVLAKHGLEPPKTLSQVEQVARKIHNPPELYAFAMRGLKYANAGVFPHTAFGFGARFFDSSGNIKMNTPEWVEALEWYARMLQNYAPPGVVGWNWYEVTSAFQQGQLGMTWDGNMFGGRFEDPEKSQVAGKVGYAVMPGGPAGQVPGVYANGLAINPFSAKKNAAWLLLLWGTNEENQYNSAAIGVTVSRKSVVADTAFLMEKTGMPEDYVKASTLSTELGDIGLPYIVAVNEFRDILGIAITNAIEGSDPKTELDLAQKQLAELIEKTEK